MYSSSFHSSWSVSHCISIYGQSEKWNEFVQKCILRAHLCISRHRHCLYSSILYEPVSHSLWCQDFHHKCFQKLLYKNKWIDNKEMINVNAPSNVWSTVNKCKESLHRTQRSKVILIHSPSVSLQYCSPWNRSCSRCSIFKLIKYKAIISHDIMKIFHLIVNTVSLIIWPVSSVYKLSPYQVQHLTAWWNYWHYVSTSYLLVDCTIKRRLESLRDFYVFERYFKTMSEMIEYINMKMWRTSNWPEQTAASSSGLQSPSDTKNQEKGDKWAEEREDVTRKGCYTN